MARAGKPFQVRFYRDGKCVVLGNYTNLLEAAVAYARYKQENEHAPDLQGQDFVYEQRVKGLGGAGGGGSPVQEKYFRRPVGRGPNGMEWDTSIGGRRG